MLVIARALVSRPRVLLLDELSLGLAPVVVRRIYSTLPELLAGADLAGWSEAMADLRADLVALLTRHGVTPHRSDANFVLCDAPPGFRDKLLGQGIVVRDCTSFGLPAQVRIAVPDSEGIERLSVALDVLTP